jgi:hypothetical protein
LLCIELLGSSGRPTLALELVEEPLTFLAVFAGEHGGASAKSVTEGVESNGGLSLGSFGASRF